MHCAIDVNSSFKEIRNKTHCTALEKEMLDHYLSVDRVDREIHPSMAAWSSGLSGQTNMVGNPIS